MPSTHEKAINLSTNGKSAFMYLKQKSALRFIIGDDSIDLNSFYFSSLSDISVSIYNAYDSECIPSIKSYIWYTNLASGY